VVLEGLGGAHAQGELQELRVEEVDQGGLHVHVVDDGADAVLVLESAVVGEDVLEREFLVEGVSAGPVLDALRFLLDSVLPLVGVVEVLVLGCLLAHAIGEHDFFDASEVMVFGFRVFFFLFFVSVSVVGVFVVCLVRVIFV